VTRHRGAAIYGALVALAAVLFTAFPPLDPWAAGWFYRDGFFLAGDPFLHFIFRAVYWITDALAILLPLALIAVLVRGRPIFGLDRLAAIFLIAALAVGPGLVVNSALKDHWGRARPSQVVEFGGAKQFTPALEPSDQCDRNCSFPAGHPAIGFYFLSFALLIPAARPRRIVFGAAILAGSLLGLMRMAQGGHFLSDVVFSGLIVFGVSWLLHDLIVRRGGIAALSGWRRLIAIGAVCLAIGAASYFFYDRPVAIWAHGFNPRAQRVALFITQFGYSRGYLIVSGALAVLFFFMAGRWRPWAWRAVFIFANVAVSGIAVDIVKWIVSRARPTMLFHEGLYGFTWFSGKSDFWSFPSGHAQTATALALSLGTIWPRLWPVWWLAAAAVIASRVVLGAHYLSDLLAGFYFAFAIWWWLRHRFARWRLLLRGSP
jgi:lipid A 4'-phosphatase